jgi:hypothetical protein
MNGIIFYCGLLRIISKVINDNKIDSINLKFCECFTLFGVIPIAVRKKESNFVIQ